MRQTTCSICGCTNGDPIVLGLCGMHYKRLRTRGDVGGPEREVLSMKGHPTEDRFWAKVNKTETCWLWTASHNGLGYGNFHAGGQRIYAHRYAYELLVGPIPKGLVLDHLCMTPSCVNPAHLEAVTQRENTLRGDAPSARAVRTGRCCRGHVYDEENTWFDKFGKRHCRHCHRDIARERYRRLHGLPL